MATDKPGSWKCFHCGKARGTVWVRQELGHRHCWWHPQVVNGVCTACELPLNDSTLPLRLYQGCTRCDHCPRILWEQAARTGHSLLVPTYAMGRRGNSSSSSSSSTGEGVIRHRRRQRRQGQEAASYISWVETYAWRDIEFYRTLPRWQVEEALDTVSRSHAQRAGESALTAAELKRYIVWLPTQPVPESLPKPPGPLNQEQQREQNDLECVAQFLTEKPPPLARAVPAQGVPDYLLALGASRPSTMAELAQRLRDDYHVSVEMQPMRLTETTVDEMVLADQHRHHSFMAAQ